jgi:hypothetical protein
VPGPLASAAAWLETYETYWNERLDALEQALLDADDEPDAPQTDDRDTDRDTDGDPQED